MPLTFPSSPTVGQQSTQNGRTYAWSGIAWELASNVSGHKAGHAIGGADALSPADIGAVPSAGGTLTGALTHAATQTFVSAGGSAASPAYSFTGDTNTGLFSSAADTLGLSTGEVQRLQIDANGNVGIGNNALSNTRLFSAFTLTNATGFGMQCNTVSAATSDGAYGVFGSQTQVTHNITAGLSNTGVSRATFVSCARNNGVSTDAGSLGFIRGIDLQYGHGNTNAALSPTTNQVIGLNLVPLLGPGTITTFYDILIGGFAHHTGTITGDHFALYQAQATAKNYFAGHVGIGTTAPTTPLDVSGSTLRLRTARTPSSTGAVGEVCWDADYVWICTATNTWRRITHSTSGAAVDSGLRAFFLPPAPTSVTATAGNAQAVVSWTAPTVLAQTPITDYIVQFSTNSGSNWTTFSDAVSTATSATITGLTNEVAHVFRVAGINGIGTGAYSTASAAVTPTAGTPPNAPTALVATAGNAQLALSWTAPSAPGTSAITGYSVEYTPSGGSATTVNTGSTATSYTLTGLTNGTSYSVRVRAVSAAGNGDYSTSVTGTPSAATVPGSPTGTSQGYGSRTGETVYNPTSATCNIGWVGWNPPVSDGGSAITGYKISGNVGTLTVGPQFRYANLGAQGSGAPYLSGYGGTVTVIAINAVGEGPAATITNYYVWEDCG